jgi:maltose O-acetyltransferase
VVVTKGVTIGDNSVIAAGAVVTHDIPPNVIAAGVPAKVLRGL